MKQVKIKLPLRALTLASGLLLTVSSFAQTNAVKGHVKDASGEPIMGATITVNGKAVGITDMDGNFSVDAAPGANLTFTYLGMTPKTIKATSNIFSCCSFSSVNALPIYTPYRFINIAFVLLGSSSYHFVG